ncbi:MAG: di-trans,poly-cis-decaprenylcistransferase [Oscillospiraceae bacterium]|jgi:undecaprenyl diphosphate synthase|nr:di-trans,poly-cis-decaprenylcistransferase [Oscillospiraceae bacterium]
MLEASQVGLPRHVGIIMDGNGRWAKARGLPRTDGHKRGAEVFELICDRCADLGIPCVTFYAFSTENWNRPPTEVAAIMDLLRHWLKKAQEREVENARKGIRLRFIGELEGLPEDIQSLAQDAQEHTRTHSRTICNLAVNYGGRLEILQAARHLAAQCQTGERDALTLTEDDISAALYTPEYPDVDLLIRPSGEQRLSNFLLWQSAYAEFWYSNTLWPDFTAAEFDRALADFARRGRRFGGI